MGRQKSKQNKPKSLKGKEFGELSNQGIVGEPGDFGEPWGPICPL